MAIFMMTVGIAILTLFCMCTMFYRLYGQPPEPLSFVLKLKLIVSGIIAFIADALGLGSFAVNVALAKFFGTFSDEELPAMNNGAQVMPGAIESLYFLHLIEVDITTLLTLVTGTCLGGLIGGTIVSKMSKQAIRLAMLCCFAAVIILLLVHQFRLLPVNGDLAELHSWKLLIGFVAMMICGTLTSAGVGLFVLVQGVLFLMNISPLVAFPIMTAAGAMQQPLTTLVFLQNNKMPLKKTLILSLAGCVGVLITLPIVAHLTVSWLHSLLLCILIYNFYAIGRNYLKEKNYRLVELSV